MVPDERRRQIRAYIERHGTATARDLAEKFGVSLMTIHRDLKKVASEGALSKVHGGAVARLVVEVPYRDRIVQRQREKAAVAAQAAKLVKAGDILYLGPGTTITEFAKALPRSGLNIVTNSLPIAHELISSSQHEIQLTGGLVRRYAEALVGPAAENAFDGIFLSYAFIAATGVDLKQGLSVYSESEAKVLQAAMKAAKYTVLLTDTSKYDKVMGPIAAPLFAVHRVICNHEVPPKYRRYFEEQHIPLTTVEVTTPTIEVTT